MLYFISSMRLDFVSGFFIKRIANSISLRIGLLFNIFGKISCILFDKSVTADSTIHICFEQQMIAMYICAVFGLH